MPRTYVADYQESKAMQMDGKKRGSKDAGRCNSLEMDELARLNMSQERRCDWETDPSAPTSEHRSGRGSTSRTDDRERKKGTRVIRQGGGWLWENESSLTDPAVLERRYSLL